MLPYDSGEPGLIEHFAVPVEKRFLLVAEDTDVHGPGVKVD
jgi:hypothetical protein